MSPAAVDWEAAWPTRRSLASADDDKQTTIEDEAPSTPSHVAAQVLTRSPSITTAAQNVQNRARSSSPGRGVVPPPVSTEAKAGQAKAGQAEHAVGAAVMYWSGTHRQWMEACVTKHNLDSRGALITYDLDVKRGAQASKIRKQNQAGDLRHLTDQQNREPLIPASMVQKVPTPVSNQATGDPAQGGALPSPERNPPGGVGSTNVPSVSAPAVPPLFTTTQAMPQSALTVQKLPSQTSGAATAGVPPSTVAAGVAGTLAAAGSTATPGGERHPPPEDMTAEASRALRRFEVGEKVEYWSGTYSQWMQAKVERIRSDQVTYDLDVKRGAQRRKMRSLKRTDLASGAPAPTVDALPLAGATIRAAVKSTSPARTAAARSPLGPVPTGTSPAANELTPAPAPLWSSGREGAASSRLRALSRDSAPGDGDDPAPKLALAPEKIAGPGGYPRSGSPGLGDKRPQAASPSSPSGNSQTAPVGDLSGPTSDASYRPRAAGSGVTSGSAGVVPPAKGRPELGRPGSVTSGSVGLAAGGGEAPRPVVQPGGLSGPGPKAPRRLLPDFSSGPNIGTRPDNVNNASLGSSAAASSAIPGGGRPGSQAAAAGQVPVNGVVKKVGPTSLSPAGPGNDKVMVQREGDKIIVRQLPGAAPPGPFSSSTPSMSSHRPPPSTISAPAASVGPAAIAAGLKLSDETVSTAVDAAEYGLNGASSAELALLARQLGADFNEMDLPSLRAQVIGALGRLPMRDLSRRLAEAQVDAPAPKDRKELERLLAQGMLARQRASGNELQQRPPTFVSASPSAMPPPELPPQPPAMSERCRGIAPAGGGAASSTACASTLVATGLSGASVLQKPQLEVGELDIGSGKFDPTESSMRSQLLTLLGYSQTSTIEEMTGFRGGLNEGVWFLSDTQQNPPVRDLVLKLVKCTRMSTRVVTEGENLVKLAADHPKIARDPAVAFPVRIFKCHGPGPERPHRYDLVVMWKAQGERMAELIAHKWYSNALEDLWQIFELLGQTLAAFHMRYNDSQHGDFQPSNVFYDEESSHISLIDIGGMGVPTSESDTEHFNKSLKLLADAYGSQLLTGQRYFEQGYAAGKRAR